MMAVGKPAIDSTNDCPYDLSEPTEQEWLRMLMAGGAFDDLADPREDIYTLEDGEPFVPDER
jgi:hypothetical protein